MTATAGAAEVLTYNYTYTTNDVDGSAYDPAGYFINGVQVQLSPPSSFQGDSNSGRVSLALAAGDSYGFYVYDTDGILGRGDIAFSSSVPEPATWSVMLIGVGLMGGVLRRRRTAVTA